MSTIAVDSAALDAKSRIAMLLLLRLNLSCMEHWRDAQLRGWGKMFDYESTLISIAVVVIGMERVNPSTLASEGLASLGAPLPPERLQKCNVSSIAATTGLNRETVRRRIAMLERHGMLLKQPGGSVTIAPGVLENPHSESAFKAQISAIVRTVNALARQGLITRESL